MYYYVPHSNALIKKLYVVAFLSFLLIATSLKPVPQPEKASLTGLETDLSRIEASTLLIEVDSSQSGEDVQRYSMGTLVQYQGENLVVTHDHFGDLLQSFTSMKFSDAQNRLIVTLDRNEFNSLIVYQDAGTLVLRAPEGLADALAPGRLYGSSPLQKGDIVQIAYRQQPDDQKVEVIDAVVVDTSSTRNTPIYNLRRLDGKSFLPGDSGGGVWYNGMLVANTWSILTTRSVIDTSGNPDLKNATLTDLSYAAIIPVVFRMGRTKGSLGTFGAWYNSDIIALYCSRSQRVL